MKYQNALGVSSRDTFEYIFGLRKDASYYYLLSHRRHLYSELMDLYNETRNQSQHQNADSMTLLRMLHGIASYYCKANNGGEIQE